jgi:hypothetical protein
MHNWLNPTHAGLLPWPDVAIANIGFELVVKPDDFQDRLEKTINLCLATGEPEEFRQSADDLKNAMDKIKDDALRQFQTIVGMNRAKPLSGQEFSEAWMRGAAQRMQADPTRFKPSEVGSHLNAYHEFEEDRLTLATRNPQYNPKRNDILDAEQLVYLGRPELQFLTCDKGYLNRIKKAPQRAQIHRAAAQELSSVAEVEKLLRRLTA